MAVAAPTTPTHSPADPTVADELRALRLEVHRLASVVTSRLAPPVTLLTVKEAAARVRKCSKTIRSWVAMGYLTDRRSGRGKGATLLLMADELDVLLTDGPDAARRYRERLGRS